MANGKRLLFFDLLRIVSVGLIVVGHIATTCRWPILDGGPLLFNIVHTDPGLVGVAILIFVSGAMLEYSHSKISSLDDISVFYVKRLFRIYPAYWMSIILGLVCVPSLVWLPPFKIFLEVIGFGTWGGRWGGYINPCGWFIGMIIVLYFVFPFLSSSIRRYPYQTLFLITVVEIVARYTLNAVWNPFLASGAERWLPLCNFLEFSLGIFIVQQDFYPKWTTDRRWVWSLAELSFYVFLVHYLWTMMDLMRASLIIYFIAVALVAWLVMVGDQRVQAWLKKRVGV